MNTVHNLIPDFDSYVADMERNVRMDRDEWARYLRNPRPYLHDLLLDYGTFPDSCSPDDVQAAVNEALDRYLGST